MDKIDLSKVVISDDQREIRPQKVAEIYHKINQRGYNPSYPITLDEQNILVDGGHRIEAAKHFDPFGFIHQRPAPGCTVGH